jgi:hypothetical protein
LLEQGAGRTAEAKNAYRRSKALANDLEDPAQRARLFLGVADLAAKLGEADEASQMYTQAMALFAKVGDASGQSSARDRLSALSSGYSDAGI